VTPTVNNTVPTTSQLEPPTVHELVLNEGLKCCHKEPNEQCRLACIRLVEEHQHLVSDKILLGLSEACNQTQSPPEHPLWECLETTYLREINNAPYFPNLQLPTLDLARLTCCFKSTSIECREECINYHLHPTPSLREGFRTNCLHSAKEVILYSCFEDVTSPSRPGCSDMGFCRMFNSHPANMFRHCGSAGNQAAHREYMEWERNQIFQHSFINVTVPLKDVSVCMTDWWKTLACFLHIQPTDNVFHTSTLCRSDCLLLMESCVDKPSLAQVNLTPEAVCNQLSPAHNDKYCVGLSPYVNAQQGQTSQGSLQYPCDDGRCQEGEVCIVNSDCVQDQQNNCQTHSCVRGCHIGLIEGVSSISVPLGQVQKLTVPLLPYNRTSTLCHSYHTCHQEHLHHSAQELTKQNFSCYQLSSCQVQGKELAHNHKLQEDCNMCVCRNGHLLCSNLTCTDRPTAIVIRKSCHMTITCISPITITSIKLHDYHMIVTCTNHTAVTHQSVRYSIYSHYDRSM
jgi:reversion-inducing cysteine-rich kazal motif protein